jgi:protein involved in polysaccharide export with SLBB domain
MIASTLTSEHSARIKVNGWFTWLVLLVWACMMPASVWAGPQAAPSTPAVTANAGTETYKLGPQDKLRLRLFEWRPNMNTVVEWPALNAEFTVSAAGTLSLPMLGEVPAAKRTPGELAQAIGERLKSTIGLAEAPTIGVEVVQYRPFYIMGGINKPGEYPYRPGLTVLQALSVAGGILGSGESGLRLGKEIIAGRGDMQQIITEIDMLMARKSRLEAESANAEKVQFSPNLEKRKGDPAVALLMQQEESIFQTRRNALQTEIAALEQLKGFFDREIISIQAQMKAQQDERDLMKKELDNIASLVSRGLTPATRQLELERAVSRMEGDRLRLESTLLNARQNLSRTDISIIEARNKHSNEVATDLRETQTKLEIAVTRYNTAERLLYETQFTSPQVLGDRSGKHPATFTIIRDSKEIQAADITPIEPGDTLKVELPMPEGIGVNSVTRAPSTH